MKQADAKTKASTQGVLDGTCMDCGVDTMARGEYYALKDAVWRAINPLVIGYLCLECAEDRLGRGLHRGDFSFTRINTTSALKCPALARRLQRTRSSAPQSASRRTATRKNTGIEAIQRPPAQKKRTRSTLGRMSAALLPYRGRSGRVAPGTLMRVLRGLMQPEPVSSPRKRAPKSQR